MKTISYKPFPPLIKAVKEVIYKVIRQKQPIDQTILEISKANRFGSRDRKFVNRFTYDIVRNYRFFSEIISSHDKNTPTIDLLILVNEFVQDDIELIQPERVFKDIEKWRKLFKLKIKSIIEEKVKSSYSDWVWDLGTKEHGNDWPSIAKGLNTSPSVYLRVNTLKTTVGKFVNDLKAQDIKLKPSGDAIVELSNKENLKNNDLYKYGHFEVQDYASQKVCTMSSIEPGMIVVDACAGAGGKALHAGALMQNKGTIYAADIHLKRMNQLGTRARRGGVRNIDRMEQSDLLKKNSFADRLLLDMPCSSTGTFRRKPELKWHLTQDRLQKFVNLQQTILEDHMHLLKVGGLLTYATCSFFKKEGEEQIRWFLDRNDRFELVKEQRFFPHTHNSDGFYVAVLKKIG